MGGNVWGLGHCIFHKIVSLLLYTGAPRKLYNCIFVFAEIFQLSFLSRIHCILLVTAFLLNNIFEGEDC